MVAELIRANRLLTRQLVRYYHAVADQLGLPVTDLTCLSVLRDRRRAHVGELAAELGLTTGAMTRVIDRLHRAGMVRRCPDPEDGRRVYVELLPEAETTIAGLFAGHAGAGPAAALHAGPRRGVTGRGGPAAPGGEGARDPPFGPCDLRRSGDGRCVLT
jgi:DNA-binding MarR family transcriptional regulator